LLSYPVKGTVSKCYGRSLTHRLWRGRVGNSERSAGNHMQSARVVEGCIGAPFSHSSSDPSAFEAWHWRPDLFLSDVNLPEVDGIQAAIETCEMFPACRVLLFSGQSDSRLLVRRAGSNGHRFEFLPKPIPPF
jgi:CheY-like chemotaxis protein